MIIGSALLLYSLSCIPLVAVLSSLVVAGGLRVGERWLSQLAPAAQSRILLIATLAPLFLSVTVWMGWGGDLDLFGYVQQASPPHLLHNEIPIVIMGSTLLWFFRLVLIGIKTIAGLVRSRSIARALEGMRSDTKSGLKVFPSEQAEAFVLGICRPQVYISQGLLTTLRGKYLEPVLAHELAHVRRRDPLRRLVAALGLAFHLPGIASFLDRRLARAHEMAADAEASQSVSDPTRIAEALIGLTRLQIRQPIASPAFLGNDLEKRIHSLLSTTSRPDHPRMGVLLTCLLIILFLAFASAEPVHHFYHRLHVSLNNNLH